MSICQTVQDWLPWYVSGHLEPAKMIRFARHIDSCDACQNELAQVVQLRLQFRSSIDATPTPSERVWQAISSNFSAPVGASLDVGSFLVGVHLGFAAGSRRSPVQGNLRVMGRKVRIIGNRKKGA